MPLLTDLPVMRWRAIKPKLACNQDAAIYKFWLAHPELGSPIGPEVDLAEDHSTPAAVGQVFANGIVIWDAANGARLG